MLAITMTQGWMIGIIAFMEVFGICAGVFSALGKKRKMTVHTSCDLVKNPV